ncbi:uncharacterized protein LOC122006759 isoform X1 [Zingiber officinale]|uniref:uncharacterized protein LOC122006759 isoform X1 n=1 Tax=Zingiber officinale TaxID=94328 RepID=UPI001C4D389A|nr:uncharacterized protein LOC122006759 isoform X1 [Zingiber officinale]
MADSSSSSSASYILMVQHLIEKCLLFHLNKDECVDALSHHAHVNPVITSTVWSELEKENKEFFEAYGKNREKSVSEMRRRQMIRTMLTSAMPPCDVKEPDHN